MFCLILYIPFKAKTGYRAAGVGYLISDRGNKAFAVETYKKNGKRITSVYYINPDGNIVVLSGDDDYWTCVRTCIIAFCYDNWGYCEACGIVCISCIEIGISCPLCLACLGAPAAYCGIYCAV
ncbi:MAG: hypothetical protein H0Z28_02370 [Archaeoglobus sp.]|nr:hypothetical protein [Archaeoglobus sp.]